MLNLAGGGLIYEGRERGGSVAIGQHMRNGVEEVSTVKSVIAFRLVV